MSDKIKNRIFALLKQMNDAKLLEKHLYQEVHEWLSTKTDDEFGQKRAELGRNYEILTKYYEHCLKQQNANQFKTKELQKHSKILLEFLRACRDDMGHYSIENILIKLELMFMEVIDIQSSSDPTSSPNPVFKDIYSTKEEKDVTANADEEKLYLLNELMDAPLDDMIIFMGKKGWSFEQFYTDEFYSDLLFYLEHQNASSNSPENIIEQLSNHITKNLMKKYKLDRIKFISLLADQFYHITPNKYRILLEKFVKNSAKRNWKLEEFFSFHQLTPIFSADDNRTFARLFEIYCIKLHDTDQSTQNNNKINSQKQNLSSYTASSRTDGSYSPYQLSYNYQPHPNKHWHQHQEQSRR